MKDLVEKQYQEAIRERRIGAGYLALVIVLMVSDIVEDLLRGDPFSHVAFESFLIVVAGGAAFYLWYRNNRLQQKTNLLSSEVLSLHKDAAFWKAEASTYLSGLGESIDKQFKSWSLTEAESDVALLLLKGFSHKEIAGLRNTSDRTIRQQATAIYSKSELDGRAQLSAFFLEDLLLPKPEPKSSSGI